MRHNLRLCLEIETAQTERVTSEGEKNERNLGMEVGERKEEEKVSVEVDRQVQLNNHLLY